MEWLRSVHPLYWVSLVFVLLALWLRDVQALYIAAACVVIGFLQTFYNEPPRRPDDEPDRDVDR